MVCTLVVPRVPRRSTLVVPRVGRSTLVVPRVGRSTLVVPLWGGVL